MTGPIMLSAMKFFFSIFLMFVSLVSLSQDQTFNYRYEIGVGSNTIFSIEITDSCFYVLGGAFDTIPPNKQVLYLGKISLEGDVISYKPFRPEESTFNVLAKDAMIKTSEDNFLISGVASTPFGPKSLLLEFESDGDTLLSKYFGNPFLPDENFITPAGGVLENFDKGFFLLNNITNPTTNPPSSDWYLIKLDEDYEIKWTAIADSNVADYSLSLLIDGQSLIMGSGNSNSNEPGATDEFQLHLLRLDTLGNVIDQFLYPADKSFLMGPADDMVLAPDGKVVVSTRMGIIFPGENLISWVPTILKIDSQLNEVLWEASLYSKQIATPVDKFEKIIALSDGSGYLAVGGQYDDPGQGTGVLFKVSPEGDSLWVRRYLGFEHFSNWHTFYDVEELPNVGFIMAGYSHDIWPDDTSEPPYQRGWIVKVDEWGCLVPGCHLALTGEEVLPPQAKVLLYPNPANDILNIYFRQPVGKPLQLYYFRIVDAQGREAHAFESSMSDLTFMLPVDAWQPGMYFLEIRNHVGLKQVFKFLLLE